MSQEIHDHSFIKNDVIPYLYTCSNCGSIKYQEKNTFKPTIFNYTTKTEESDAFSSFFALLSAQQNMHWNYNDIISASNYINNRIQGIIQIKRIANHYGLDEKAYHSAIYLMDYVYIKLKSQKDIMQMSLLCLVLIVKFYCDQEIAHQLEKDLFSCNIHLYEREDEIELLRLLNYDLFFVTAYDILSFFLNNGVILEEEISKCSCVEKIYFSCLMQLNTEVERSYYVQFLPFQLAFTIISLVREMAYLPPRNKLLEELYGYDLCYYIDCYNTLKMKMKESRMKKRIFLS